MKDSYIIIMAFVGILLDICLVWLSYHWFGIWGLVSLTLLFVSAPFIFAHIIKDKDE